MERFYHHFIECLLIFSFHIGFINELCTKNIKLSPKMFKSFNDFIDN